ncbi:MAG: hypothetical protein ACXU8U_10740 [Asticcacaulis sp.]
MIRKLLIFVLQFVCVLAAVMAALVIWDLHHNGMEYLHTPLFSQDLTGFARIALAVTVLIFLVAICYSATRRTLRLPGPRDNDVW